VSSQIPRSYYSATTAAPPWYAKIPGYRSNTAWRMAVATLAYVSALVAPFALIAIVVAAIGAGSASAHRTNTPSPPSQGVVAAAPATHNPTPSSTQNPSPTPASKPSPSPAVPSPIPSPKLAPAPSPLPSPKPPPPPPPPPPANTCGAPANPWGYNFCGGSLIYSPPSNFCAYFNCIPSFWQSTKGYVDECKDGSYSHSGGRSGACSYHGGELRPLYS
jgi:hypothetical protein